MNIIFRADANQNIGMGHIMRCLSIADIFKKKCNSVTFVTSDECVSSYIHGRGYKTVILNTCYKNMEGELNIWPDTSGVDIIVVDSYYVTAEYLSSLKSKAKLAYIDDTSDFPYNVDVLVNYNAYASNDMYEALYMNSNIKFPKLILGSQYAPLRGMFSGIERKKQGKIVKDVLISTGGSDELHVSLAIIHELVKNNRSDIKFHFLLGSMNNDKREIYSLSTKTDNIIIHENVVEMKKLICDMDIVVSASGSTLYEICACGVPLITYSMADNQMQGAEVFGKIGLAVNIGDIRDKNTLNYGMNGLDIISINKIINAVYVLALDYDKRRDMGILMQNMVDGNGAERIVNELIC